MTKPSPPEQKSLVGYTIGKCKLLRICGRGAMGTVYKGMHGGLDIEVAVKILPPHLANNSNLVERFLREAKLAARLNHANTVRVYDVGEESGYYYLVMEFIDGTDALELVRKYGPQEAAVVADIGAGAARALASAHANNVIHRDIKPANLMLPNNGGVKVADFGLARALASESGLTMTGAIMGTPDYMAPEQAQGVAVGPKADVYSLGATLYHLFVGRPPFSGSTPMAVALQHVTNRIVVPEERVKDDASMKLTRVIHEMTQKDHDKRPGDLDAIATKLADIARMNRRTRKLLFEGATIFATTGFKVDSEAINQQKATEAAAAIDKGRVESPHLEALRKAAEKARTSSPALPALGPGTVTPPMPAQPPARSAPQIPPELAELTQDMVREAKARARRSSGEVKSLPRDSDTAMRRATSNPQMSPHRDTRPGTGSSARRKAAPPPEEPAQSDWESYAAKSFPTFQKNNILDGSASAIVASERGGSGSWDAAPGSSPSHAGRPDYSKPQAFDDKVVVASRTKGGGAMNLVVVLLILGAAAAAGWYFFLRDETPGPQNAPRPTPTISIELTATHWAGTENGVPFTALCAAGPNTWLTADEGGRIRRWLAGKQEPIAEGLLEQVTVTSMAVRGDGTRVAVGTRNGDVILLSAQSLQVATPLVARVPGVTSLYFHQALLLIGDAKGMMRKGDGSDAGVKVSDSGEPVTSISARGDEVWAAAGRTMKRFVLESGALKEVGAIKDLPAAITTIVHTERGSFAILDGKLQRISGTGLAEPVYELKQPAATLLDGGPYIAAVGGPGISFLNPETLEVAGFAQLDLTDPIRLGAAVPGELAAVFATDKGNLIYCRRK